MDNPTPPCRCGLMPHTHLSRTKLQWQHIWKRTWSYWPHKPWWTFPPTTPRTGTFSAVQLHKYLKTPKPMIGQNSWLHVHIYIFNLCLQLSLLLILRKRINRCNLPQRKLYTANKWIKDIRSCHAGMHVYFPAGGRIMHIHSKIQAITLNTTHQKWVKHVCLPLWGLITSSRRALQQTQLLTTFWLWQQCQGTWKEMAATNTMSSVTASKAWLKRSFPVLFDAM